MIYGRPEGCPHNRYLDWLYRKLTGQSAHETLASAVNAAVRLAQRNDGVASDVSIGKDALNAEIDEPI